MAFPIETIFRWRGRNNIEDTSLTAR